METQTSTDENGVSVTLKASNDFSAPWVVVRGGSVGEVSTILEDKDEVTKLLNIAANAATAFQGVYATAKGLPGATVAEVQQGQSAPQAPPQQQAPQGGGTPPPQCQHGTMVQRSAKPDAARQWSAFFCPTPKGTPGQCKPIDAKTGKPWG